MSSLKILSHAMLVLLKSEGLNGNLKSGCVWLIVWAELGVYRVEFVEVKILSIAFQEK